MGGQSHEDDFAHNLISTIATTAGGFAGVLGGLHGAMGAASTLGPAAGLAASAAGGLAIGVGGGYLLDQTNGHGEDGNQDVFDIAADWGVSAEDAIESLFGSKEGDGSFGDIAGDNVGVGIGGGGGAVLGAAELGLLGPMGLLTGFL